MNTKYLKNLFFISGLFMLFLGCQRDDICPEATQTTPMLVVRFYDAEERDNPARPTNLSIRSTVSDSTKTLYQRINQDSIAIPLRTNQNATSYTFTIFDSDSEEEDQEFTPNTDNLTFTYGSEEIYVNRACAYKVIYNSLKLTIEGGEDDQWIDSYIIEEPNIEDETQAHISIFF
ncbi:hypothetical protein SAMN05660776_0622 [Salegentibacter holothuriorum]|uniref:Uncharacterized protein n=1 Tax=Salegentibacter holothuriorum TaxID=241145 RepID=A0A1T5AKB4_9FLAO|nr:DUF6452 family protein [Salegentibacter holothuriorum]SKB35043.1 hypothetical protein SAMN05660776_0622 [Salegentibacter holothuriorum]